MPRWFCVQAMRCPEVPGYRQCDGKSWGVGNKRHLCEAPPSLARPKAYRLEGRRKPVLLEAILLDLLGSFRLMVGWWWPG